MVNINLAVSDLVAVVGDLQWGRGSPGEGWLHSKVWTDAHMNAKGF